MGRPRFWVSTSVALALGCGFEGPSELVVGAGGDGSPSDADPLAPDTGALGDPDAMEMLGFPYTPSNFDPDTLTPGDAVVLNCSASYDTSDPSDFSNWCGQPVPAMTILTPDDGPEVVVLAMASFTIDTDNQLVVTGGRGLILASYDSVAIRGDLLADANLGARGPGGNVACTPGTGTSGTSSSTGGGGGGGGHATAGTAGEASAPGTAGGTGGGIALGDATLIPLRGGCDGGDGGSAGVGEGNGGGAGGGGGALQISAAGVMSIADIVTVSGGGGTGGTNEDGGGGGGSGGGLLLEANALTVEMSGRLTANGGGGGEGGANGSCNCDEGDDGLRASGNRANGGSGKSSSGGNGGAGGALAGGPTAAEAGQSGDGGGGGGGGSAGRIRLNGITGCTIIGGSVISPAHAGSGPGC